ncbi:MAG TPA: hypothetical protein VLQ20_13135 [Planococcus sp. (in: firmicutes)]|nr:hypothetical protein [Planococcus sp. (in: firmicutes)]
MKSLLKFFVYVIALVSLSIGSYHLILSSGLAVGLGAAAVLLLFCAILFIVSFYAMIKGGFAFLRIANSGEAAGLMVFSVLLFSVVTFVAVINSFVEYTVAERELSHTEKTRIFTSTVLQIPTQQELQKEMRNGVAYYHTEENADAIENFDGVLAEKREEFNTFFGTQDKGGLAIEFHEEYSSLEDSGGMEEISGFYNGANRTIHLVPDDPFWEVILIHEYAHYQSHLFAEKHGLNFNRTPQWFEEGMADYLANDVATWLDLETVEIVDFHSLDDPGNFDAAFSDDFDPYAQSSLAVASIVEAHGEERITELLATQSVAEFYSSLKEITQQDLAEFQETFLDEMISDQQETDAQFNRLITAIEMERYAEAERYAADILETGSEYDTDEAMWLMMDMYLQQGQFKKAADYTEQKFEDNASLFPIDDLLFLSEIYLLTDTGQALEYHLAAEKEAEASGETDYYDFGLTVPAYEKVNGADRLEGFKMLIEENSIYNEFILEQLLKQLEAEYPGEF